MILADSVRSGRRPTRQPSRRRIPYAIGSTEIVPARPRDIARDENLSVAFQVINAQSADTGKPDVDVELPGGAAQRRTRTGGRVVHAAELHRHDVAARFDLRLGHPLFATVSAPLATLKRGAYRLKILVNDRIANTVVNADDRFQRDRHAAIAAREAPPLGPPFRREAVLSTGRARAHPRRASRRHRHRRRCARALRLARPAKPAICWLKSRCRPPKKACARRCTGWRSSRRRCLRGGAVPARAQQNRRPVAAAGSAPSSCSAPRAPCSHAMPTRSPRGRKRSPPDRRRRSPRNCCSTRTAEKRSAQGARCWREDGAATDREWIRAVASSTSPPSEADAIALLDAHLTAQPDDPTPSGCCCMRCSRSSCVTTARRARGRYANASRSTRARYIDAKGDNSALAGMACGNGQKRGYFFVFYKAAAQAAFPASSANISCVTRRSRSADRL